jgi:hypothetical protein
MAQPDSLVRLRQLNNPDVSGYIVDVLRHYLITGSVTGIATNTGVLVSVFYPLTSNPSGYVTSGQITGFATRLDVTGNNQNLLAYIDSIYYPRVNPSGFIGTGQGDARYLQGNHFQNSTDFQLFDAPNGLRVVDYVTDDSFILQGFGGNQNIGKIIFAQTTLDFPKIFGFDISGRNITGQTLNGDPIMSSGYVSNHFIPLSKVTAGQAGNGFQYLLLQDAVKSTQFLFEQGANFYMQGRHNVNVSAPYVIDLYGSTGPSYGFTSGQPFIRGFYINADKLQKSGVDVLLTSDISASGLATYAQLTGASGILHDADGTLSTRIVNTGNFLYNLITGVSGQNVNSQTLQNVVFQTGDQTISGVKTFRNNINVSGNVNVTGELHVDTITTHFINDDLRIDVVNRQLYDDQPFVSVDWGADQLLFNSNITLDWQRQILSGTWNAQGLTINGSGIPDFSKVVFKTGDQTIGGNKTFTNNISIQGILTPQFIQTYDVLSEGTIYDLASTPSLKWETRKLLDGTGMISVDWASRILSGNWKILTTSGNEVSLNNLVLLTTDQTIDGAKSFLQIATFEQGLDGPIDGGGHLRWSIDSLGNTIIGRRTVQSALEFSRNSLAGYDGSLTSDFYPLYYFDHDNHNANFYIPVNVSGYILITGQDPSIGGGLYVDDIRSTSSPADPHIKVLDRQLINATLLPTVDWGNSILSGTWIAQRLRLSGQSVTTGGPYYPLNSNPSGYVTAAQAGGVQNIIVSGASISGNVTFTGISGINVSRTGQTVVFSAGTAGNTGALTGVFYPLASNPSGYINDLSSVVFTTGTQTISGAKTFATQVSISNGGLSGPTVFSSSNQLLYDGTNGQVSVDWNNRLLGSGSTNYALDYGNRILSGAWTISGASLTTGGPYYPLTLNPSGFITSSQTGQFYAASNPNAYISTYQAIKTLNITGLLISGNVIVTGAGNITVTTGSGQAIVISGNTSNLVTTGQTGSFITTAMTGGFVDTAHTGSFLTLTNVGGVRTINVTGLLSSGALTLTGLGNITLTQSGQVITISGTATTGSQSLSNVVFTTGNQTIDGIKSFNLSPTFSAGMNGPLDGGGHLRWSVDSLGSTAIGRRVVGSALEFSKDSLNGYDGNLTADFYSLYTFDHGNHHADFRIPVNVSGDVNITGKLLVSGISLTEKIVYTTGDQIISGQKIFLGLVGTNIITAGGFGDDTRIDLVNRQLLDSTPNPVVDWNLYQLNGIGGLTVDWNSTILTGGNWKVQGLNVSGISINPNTVLTSSNQNVSGIKQFYNQTKFLSGLNTSGNVDITGSLNVRSTLNVDNITTSSSDTDIRVDVVNRQLFDNTPIATVDWGIGQLIFNGALMVDWQRNLLSGGNWQAQALRVSGVSVTTGGPYYPLSNPMGYLSSTTGVVVTTGDQILISGFKNFATSLGVGTGASPRGIFDVRSGNIDFYFDASGTVYNSGSGRFAKNLSVTNIDVTSITHSAASNLLIVPASGQKCSFVISGANAGMITFRKDVPATATSDRVFQFTNAADSAEFFSWDIDTNANPLFNLHSKDFIWGKAPAGTFSQTMRLTNAGKLGIGISAPTAFLHLTGGGGANGAALKINSYPVLATPESGAIEFDGTSLYYTDSTATRRTLSTGNAVGGGGVTSLTASGTSISGAITLSGQGIGVTSSGQNIIFKNYVQTRTVNTTIDWSSGNSFGNTLTGNTTVSFVGQQDGQSITVAMTNSSGNGFLVTWPTGTNGIKWPNGTQPVQSSGNPADVTDIYTFLDITGKVYGNVVQKFY